MINQQEANRTLDADAAARKEKWKEKANMHFPHVYSRGIEIELTQATDDTFWQQQYEKAYEKRFGGLSQHAQNLFLATLENRLSEFEQYAAEVNAQDKFGLTPLHDAVIRGQVGAVNALMALGADVTKKSDTGMTALHYAAQNGHILVIRELSKASIEVNALDSYGYPPIYHAVINGQILAIEELEEAGADLKWRDKNGFTLVHFAAKSDQVGVLQLLNETYHLNMGIVCTKGQKPIDIAKRHNSMAALEILESYGQKLSRLHPVERGQKRELLKSCDEMRQNFEQLAPEKKSKAASILTGMLKTFENRPNEKLSSAEQVQDVARALPHSTASSISNFFRPQIGTRRRELSEVGRVYKK